MVFNPNCGTFYPERLMITPEMSLETFRALTELNALQLGLFKLVVPDVEPTLESLQNGHSGFQYLMGLIAATLNCILLRQKFGWKYPETGLHPKYQGNLADLMLLLSNQPKFVQFIQAIKERTS